MLIKFTRSRTAGESTDNELLIHHLYHVYMCLAALCSDMYAIVSSCSTSELWSSAIKTLKEKYENKWPGKVHEVFYDSKTADVTSCLPRLREVRPSYCCFVAHYSECSRQYVHQIHELTSQIDPSNPYTDTIWGILTGLEENDLNFALQQDNLVTRKVLTHCPVELAQFESGDWYSELEPCVHYRKTSTNSETKKCECPQDTIRLFADALGEKREVESGKGVDMIITSAHATEKDWRPGFTYKNGKFICKNGDLVGIDCSGVQHKVQHSGNPKVYSAAGNCLMGHIDGADCMALAWMHSTGVVQMTGYLVPTWYGYGGWGVHKYFINLPGMYSFAEAFFANMQALRAELYHACGDESSQRSSQHGLVHDKNEVVFYGDPAWDARLAANLDRCPYVITLVEVQVYGVLGSSWKAWKLTVIPRSGGSWDCPEADDKFTTPGRPPVYIFPCAAKNYKLLQGNAVLNCRFILVPLSGPVKEDIEHSVVFALEY